ncbi:DUF4390 domain-containing protein [Gammaproteobacteria bacterium]
MFLRNLLYLLILFAWGTPAPGMDLHEFRVRSASAILVSGVYQLQARLELNLSDEVLQALESGVPITLILDMTVERKRRYIPWNESVASLEQRYRLEFHSLSEQYRVTNLNADVRETYHNLEHALRAIGELEDFPMLDRRLLSSREHYEVGLRVRLDIESLPSPLRVVAYVSPGWRLVSPWYFFPLVVNPLR